MPPRRRRGLSRPAILAITVVVILAAIGGYFLQKALLAKPGTFGYTLPNYQYILPPYDYSTPGR